MCLSSVLFRSLFFCAVYVHDVDFESEQNILDDIFPPFALLAPILLFRFVFICRQRDLPLFPPRPHLIPFFLGLTYCFVIHLSWLNCHCVSNNQKPVQNTASDPENWKNKKEKMSRRFLFSFKCYKKSAKRWKLTSVIYIYIDGTLNFFISREQKKKTKNRHTQSETVYFATFRTVEWLSVGAQNTSFSVVAAAVRCWCWCCGNSFALCALMQWLLVCVAHRIFLPAVAAQAHTVLICLKRRGIKSTRLR